MNKNIFLLSIIGVLILLLGLSIGYIMQLRNPNNDSVGNNQIIRAIGVPSVNGVLERVQDDQIDIRVSPEALITILLTQNTSLVRQSPKDVDAYRQELEVYNAQGGTIPQSYNRENISKNQLIVGQRITINMIQDDNQQNIAESVIIFSEE